MNNGMFSYPRGSLKELVDKRTAEATPNTGSSSFSKSSAYAHYQVYLPDDVLITIPDHVDEILVMIFGSGGNVQNIGTRGQNGAGGGGFVMANVDTTIDKTFVCSINSSGSNSTIFGTFLAAFGGGSYGGSTSAALSPAYNVVQFQGGTGGQGLNGTGSGGGGGGGSPYGPGGNGGRLGGGGGGFGGHGGELHGGGGGGIFNGGAVRTTSQIGVGGGGTETEGKLNHVKGGNGKDVPQDVFLALLNKSLSGSGGDGGGTSSRGGTGGNGGGGGGGKGGGDGGFGGGGGGGLLGGNTYGGVSSGAGGFGGGAGGTSNGGTDIQNNGIGGGGTSNFRGGSGCIVVYWR